MADHLHPQRRGGVSTENIALDLWSVEIGGNFRGNGNIRSNELQIRCMHIETISGKNDASVRCRAIEGILKELGENT